MIGIVLLAIWLAVIIILLSFGIAIDRSLVGVFLAGCAAVILGIIFLLIWAVATVFTFAFPGAPAVVLVALVILVLLIVL